MAPSGWRISCATACSTSRGAIAGSVAVEEIDKAVTNSYTASRQSSQAVFRSRELIELRAHALAERLAVHAFSGEMSLRGFHHHAHLF